MPATDVEFSLEDWLTRQIKFSSKTFGEGARSEGIAKHIEKEVGEIRKNPADLFEWLDVAILAFDGAWRAGYSPEIIVKGLELKLAINQNRKWPAPTSEDKAVEHVREVAA
jgi:hypothetical protein